jgi:transcriptional regulator with XRE-family HTH domain
METNPSPHRRPPTPDAIAAFVKLQRALFGWKQDTLASLAEVSLSTVQRVERGEAVRPAQLEKLAVALKREPDVFTRKVTPLTPAEALEALQRDAAWMDGRVRVTVAPLRKEAQVRELAETELLVADSDIGDEVAGAVSELREWFDLASFIRMEHSGSIQSASLRKAPLREFYQNLLESVRRIEIEHGAVCLAGTYEVATTGPLGDTVRVAVIALRSRENNPAAATIKTLWAEGSVDPRDIAWNYNE